jgi:tRNA-dihydrouridine synthase B
LNGSAVFLFPCPVLSANDQARSMDSDEDNMPNPYLHPLKIGSVQLANNLALAPMAGTTDATFRPICHELGAGLVVTELVSARGICYDTDLRRSWRYLEIVPAAEKPVAIQLFGADPADFARAILRIHEHPVLAQCDMIDLNMGCPVPKVVRGGEGSALMKDPALAGRIIEAAVQALEQVANAGADVSGGGCCTVKPVTVKFRKGWDGQQINAVEFARVCETAGASAIAVHARTRDQFYSGRADWDIIAAVKQAVNIPVYGNGDLSGPESARRMIDQTGVDGLMVGRAALGNPWIFQQLATELAGYIPVDGSANASESSSVAINSGSLASAPEGLAHWLPPSTEDRAAMMLRHLSGLVSRLGEHTGVAEMRKQLAAYLRGTPQAAHWKNLVMQARSAAEVEQILGDWTHGLKEISP